MFRIFWMPNLRPSHLLFLPKFRLVGFIVLSLANSALKGTVLLCAAVSLLRRSTGEDSKIQLKASLVESSTLAHYESIE